MEATVELFKTLPTFEWLAAAGIIPSKTATWSRNEIVGALKAAYGFTVGLECQSNTLKQVFYYHHVSVCHKLSRIFDRFRRTSANENIPQVKGSIQNGQYTRVNAIKPGSCPPGGIKYVPKH